jgi:putative ABC transport system permease protein
MYMIEHALLNLGKNKGRNILLGLIIFVIITATTVALTIFNTTGAVLQETRNAMESSLRIVSSGNQQLIDGKAVAMISLEQYKSFAESEYLDGADIKESRTGVDAIYFLKHPDMLVKFEIELRNKGLPDDYSVISDESAFQNIIEPVEQLQSLTLTFLIIVLALGAVIMVLLSAIVIRERKYEIGVLRAMGMKKEKVALGLWVETIVVTCICIVLGMGLGAVLSQPISDAIMTGQTETSSAATTLADRMAEQGMTQTEEAISVDVSIDAVTALQIFCISILLASIAGIISVSSITKSEPIKILMDRT